MPRGRAICTHEALPRGLPRREDAMQGQFEIGNLAIDTFERVGLRKATRVTLCTYTLCVPHPVNGETRPKRARALLDGKRNHVGKWRGAIASHLREDAGLTLCDVIEGQESSVDGHGPLPGQFDFGDNPAMPDK